MSERTVFLPVDQAYDRWSSTYDSYDNPMVFAANEVVTRLAPLSTGRDVFEFGCGTGRNLLLFKRAGAAGVAGCDLSEGMLARASERDADLRLLRHDMAQPLPIEGSGADLVLFCLSLEHIGDLAQPLRDARRLLRPSGIVVIVEIHPYLSLLNIAAHFREGETVVQMPTFPHSFSEYITAAVESGLEVAECREWRPCDFSGPLPPKLLKRGPDTPLLVEFRLRPKVMR